MVKFSSAKAKEMFTRTIDLILGYSTVTKMENIKELATEMTQAVDKLKAPPKAHNHTPLSILKQFQQLYRHIGANPSDKRTLRVSGDPYIGSMPNSHIESLDISRSHYTLRSTGGHHGVTRPESPTAMLRSINEFINQTTSEQQEQIPSSSSPSSSEIPAPISNDLPSVYLYDIEELNEPQTHQQPSETNQNHPSNHHYYHHHHHQHQRQSSGGDELYSNITGHDDSRPIATSNLLNLDSTEYLPFSSEKPRASMPPPKPPKRVLPQSTGSTNSSNKSASQRPPVPKKPSRLSDKLAIDSLTHLGIRDTRLLHPIPNLTQRQSALPPLQPNKNRPVVRPLQAQPQLYGMGVLESSLNTTKPRTSKDQSKDHLSLVEDLCLDLNYSAIHDYPFECK
jgi:hypothetical protein